jgi:hypothetical protein
MYETTRIPFGGTFLALCAAVSLILLSGCAGTGSPHAAGSSTKPTATSTAPTQTPSQSPSPSASTPGSQQPAQPPPAGYRWIGSSTQRFWLAVPRDWVALDFSKISITAAIRKASLKGVGNPALVTEFQDLKRRHALFVADPASAVNSPHQFATNANVFCSTTVIQPGPGAADALDSTIKAVYVKIHAHLVGLKNTVTSTKVIITSELTAQTSGGYTLTEIQVTELTSQSRICELSMATDQPAGYLHMMRKIGTTLHPS